MRYQDLKSMLRSVAVLAAMAGSVSALVVSPATADELAARLVGTSTPGLNIISASFFGNVAIQGGLFSDGPGGLSQGIILSNGRASGAVLGPGQSPGSSATNNNLALPGSPVCTVIRNVANLDAAVLTLTLEVDRSLYDTLRLTYVVGTSDGGYDIFGVLVNGRIAASVAGTRTASTTTGYSQEGPQRAESVALLPNETTVKLEIAVCDRGDYSVDTAMFLAPLQLLKLSETTTTAIQSSTSSTSSDSTTAEATSTDTVATETSTTGVTLPSVTVTLPTAIGTTSDTTSIGRSSTEMSAADSATSQAPTNSSTAETTAETTVLQTDTVQSTKASAASLETTAAQTTTTEFASVTPTLPPATAVTTFALSVSGTPLICPGTVITVAPAATAASLITIDSNGVLFCEGKQAYLRPQPSPSQLFDVVLYTPPPPTGMGILTSYFSLASGSLVAQFTPFMRRRRRQAGTLPVGLGQSNTLVAGAGISPVMGSPLLVPTGSASSLSTAVPASSSSSSSMMPTSTAALSTPSFSSGATGGIGPVNTTPVTVTSTATLTVPGTTQTVVVLQIFINGSPMLSSGFGAGGLVTTARQVIVYVTIGGLVVSVSAGGFLPISPTVISGSPALGGFAPVIINVVVLVAPVVVQVGGSVVTSLSTMQAYVTAVAGGAGLTQGSGAVTLVNLSPVATVTATQTIMVPSVNAAGVTIVPAVPVSGVAAVVLSPGAVPSGITAAIAANAAANAAPTNRLPSSRSAGDKVVPALLAAVVAVLFASYVV